MSLGYQRGYRWDSAQQLAPLIASCELMWTEVEAGVPSMKTYHDENQDDGSRSRFRDAIHNCDPGLAAGVQQIRPNISYSEHEGERHEESEYI